MKPSTPKGATRDPARTRHRILEAATRQFAAEGLGGARVDRIAAEAGANKRMLYHYFGGKEALFTAVVERVYQEICEAAERLNLERSPPVDGVRRVVRFIWSFYRDHPEAISLLNSENLYRARHIADSDTVRALTPPFVATLSDLLERGAAAGEFRRNVDPADFYISVVALVYYYRSNRFTLSAFFGRDLIGERAQVRWRRHVENVILGYLRPLAAHVAEPPA